MKKTTAALFAGLLVLAGANGAHAQTASKDWAELCKGNKTAIQSTTALIRDEQHIAKSLEPKTVLEEAIHAHDVYVVSHKQLQDWVSVNVLRTEPEPPTLEESISMQRLSSEEELKRNVQIHLAQLTATKQYYQVVDLYCRLPDRLPR